MSSQKSILITGATEGIGLATAITLARQGHKIMLHGRNAQKLDAASRAVSSASGAKGAPPQLFLADFDRLEGVRDLASRVAQAGPLDVLINNAGAMFSDRQTTKDGFEASFGVNYLAPSLLTLELQRSTLLEPRQRVVFVSSVGYKSAKPNPEDLQMTGSYSMMGAYFSSKLFNLYAALTLAEKLGTAGPLVNAVHPGGVSTQLARDFEGPMRWVFSVMMPLFFISPEKGARSSVYAAVDPSISWSGRYISDARPEALTPIGADAGLRQHVWQETLKCLRTALPGWAPPSALA